MNILVTKSELIQKIRYALIAKPHLDEALLGEENSKNPALASSSYKRVQ